MSCVAAQTPAEVEEWFASELFEHAPLSILVIDEDRRVVHSNQNFAAVFGDPSGKTCYQAYKKEPHECAQCEAAKTLRDGRSRISEGRGIDCIGKRVDYVVHHAAIGNGSGTGSYVVNMSYDVTDEKSFQSQYNLVFQRAPCSLTVIDRDFRILRANQQARSSYGHVVGSHCYEIYKQQPERCGDCPAQETFSDECLHSSEQIRQTSAGAYTYHMVSTAPLPDGVGHVGHVVEMSVDVTDMYRLSEKLLEESVFRENITESALDALVATDKDGVVTVYNDAAEALFKMKRGEVVGKARAERFFPEEFCGRIRDHGEALALRETHVIDASGAHIPVRFSGAVLRHGAKVIGGAAYFQDLREIKELERAKLDSDRLATVGQAVTQFAHSIKNILTGLQGGIYDIKVGRARSLPERSAMGVELLERNLARITELVRRFLQFSKDYVPEFCLHDPNALAEEIYGLYRGVGERAGIAVTVKPQANLAPTVLDPRGIHSCLANLVANAIEACEEAGKPHMSVSLEVAERDGAVVFVVSDTGCGMSEEASREAFTNIFTTKGGRGTGLGLMMTRKIVEDHGGTIRVDSKIGAGTTMTMVLPRSPLGVVRRQNHGESNSGS